MNSPISNDLLQFRTWDRETEMEYYLSCRREGWISSHGSITGFNADAFRAAVTSHSMFSPDSVMVVMAEQEPVGFLELDLKKGGDESVGAIPFVYLDPAHRRNGRGVQLLDQAMQVFRAMGRTKLRLRCAPENESAYRFYTRHGFQQIGMAEDSVVPLYLMERQI